MLYLSLAMSMFAFNAQKLHTDIMLIILFPYVIPNF